MNMRKLTFLAILSFLAHPVYADVAGVRLSGGIFDYEATGNVRDSANAADQVDIKGTLGLQDDSDTMAYIYIEHPVPLIPNFRIGTTALKLAGSGVLSGSFNYNGETFAASSTVNSELDLSHTEVALYYEVIDTGIDFDLGLNVKFFDGQVRLVEVGGSNSTASTTLDETIPMLYGALNIPLLGGFSLAGDLSTISYDGSTLTDYLVRIRYVSDYALGAELGYRSFTIDYEDTTANEFADVKVSGPYFMLHLAF